MTIPLSRITSMTSARPLGRGRSRYPRGVVAMDMASSVRVVCLGSGLAGLLVGQWLFRAVHEPPADERPVLGQRLGDVRLVDAVEVADRPVELLQGVLGGLAVLLRVGLHVLGTLLVVPARHADPP